MSLFRRNIISSIEGEVVYYTKFLLKYEYGNANNVYRYYDDAVTETYAIGFNYDYGSSSISTVYLVGEGTLDALLTKKDSGEIIYKSSWTISDGDSGGGFRWIDSELLGDGLYEMELTFHFKGEPKTKGSFDVEPTGYAVITIADSSWTEPLDTSKNPIKNYIMCLSVVEAARPADKFHFTMTRVS